MNRPLLPVFVFAIPVCALAADPVWQVGKPDDSFRDLANAANVFGNYPNAFPNDVKFEPGKSDPAKDFSAAQPGPIDIWAGSRSHPFQILFDLPESKAPAYELAIDMVDTQSQYAPVLQVRVNDQRASFPLGQGVGDIVALHPEKGKHPKLKLTLPADILKPTGNTIELTITSGSWILYDAITLRPSEIDAKRPLDISIHPTIFLTEKDGEIRQEAVVRAQPIFSSQPASLLVNTGPDSNPWQPIPLGRGQLGVLTARVSIPATDKKRGLRARIVVGDQSAETEIQQEPVKKWCIYVAPSTHTDIGYTDFQDRVIQVHNRNTDLALELAAQYPLYHWNLESSWAAQMWLRDNPWRHEELYKAAQGHRLGVEAGYLNMLTGLCSQEELIRNMYYTARLAREHGVPFESLTLTDAPSHVWTVPSVLAGAGIKYLSCGVNQTRAPLFKKGLNRKSPFWWEGPDGGRVMTWLADGYSQAELIGLKGGVNHAREVIDAYMTSWNRRTDYPYDAILLHGAYSDNLSIGREIAETITDYAKQYAYPKVILASNYDFFKHIEDHFGDQVPTLTGCGGSWWEDGAASTAYETAQNRNNHERIAAAEAAWAVLKSMDQQAIMPQERINNVWDNILLYDEHTWGAFNSITDPASDFVARQWAVKADYARQADLESKRLVDEALHGIGARIKGEGKMVIVFNPSGKKRSGVVEADIPRGQAVFDGDKYAAQQTLREGTLKTITVAFQAKDVPPLGYRAYSLRSAPGDQLTAKPATITGTSIENQFYRVTFDDKTGGIKSLFDKRRSKELVDAGSPYKLGELIYAAGGDEKGQTQVLCPNPAGVKTHVPHDVRIEAGPVGSVESSLRSIGKAESFPHIEISAVLYQETPRIDLVVTLQKTMSLKKEAVYIAFPFAGKNPQFRYEIGGGNVRPNEDHLPGGCRDWFSIQRWLTLKTDQGAVAWSASDTPLIQLCDIQAGKWLDEVPITNGTVLAYVMNNYWFTNYKAGQDGKFSFRYSITSADEIDPAAATRFGMDVQDPLSVSVIDAAKEAALPTTGSLVSVERANVEVSSVKPAEDGRGIIVRVHETGGVACEARLKLNLTSIKTATACDLVERDRGGLAINDGEIEFSFKPYGTQSIRLK